MQEDPSLKMNATEQRQCVKTCNRIVEVVTESTQDNYAAKKLHTVWLLVQQNEVNHSKFTSEWQRPG
jgi:hypothetical protein